MARGRGPRRGTLAQTRARGRGGTLLVLAGAAVGLALLLGIWLLAGIGGDSGEAADRGGRPETPSVPVARDEGPEVVRLTDDHDWDIFDERLLVGYSDNVFSGRVVEKAGTEAAWTSIPDDEENPHTRYAVKVTGVVKATGAAPVSTGGRVVVDQLGGIGEDTGRLHVAAAHYCEPAAQGEQKEPPPPVVDAPLEVGREYLFATIHDAGERIYAISAPPAGDRPVEGPEEREALLAAYERAAEEQVDPLRAGEAKPELSCH